MTDFTRVNLVVGNNNSGKTSTLEGIELLVADGHISVFYGAARRRGESTPYLRRGYGPDISNLFFGHECEPGAYFELSSDDNRQLKAKVKSLDEVGDINWPKIPLLEREDQIEPAFALSIVSKATDRDAVVPLTESGSIIDHRISRRTESVEQSVQFLALESFAAAPMGRAWNRILIDGREEEVVKDMRILLPDIDSIHFLTSERPTGSGIFVGSSQRSGRRVPIGSYGDGVRRLLAFRLALAGATNGFVLIDEIDAGLHWTVIEDIWRLLGEVAERLNVQVFATTHSLDCIRGLGALIEAHPHLADQFSIHKIDQSLPQAVSLHGAHIPVAVRQDIEMR